MENKSIGFFDEAVTFTSKSELADYAQLLLNEITDKLKNNGYRFDDAGKFVSFQGIRNSDSELYAEYEEMAYIVEGLQRESWPDVITNDYQHKRFNVISEKMRDIIYNFNSPATFL